MASTDFSSIERAHFLCCEKLWKWGSAIWSSTVLAASYSGCDENASGLDVDLLLNSTRATNHRVSAVTAGFVDISLALDHDQAKNHLKTSNA